MKVEQTAERRPKGGDGAIVIEIEIVAFLVVHEHELQKDRLDLRFARWKQAENALSPISALVRLVRVTLTYDWMNLSCSCQDQPPTRLLSGTSGFMHRY